jgi:hypothetical protein
MSSRLIEANKFINVKYSVIFAYKGFTIFRMIAI